MPLAATSESAATRQPVARPAEQALPGPHGLILYVGIPLLVAMIMAWNPTGQRAPLMPGYILATLYWMGILLPLWVLMDACTRALQHGLKLVSITPPLLMLLIIGAIVATLPMRGYLIYYWAMIDRLLDPTSARTFAELPGLWPESVGQFAQSVQRAGVLLGLWVAVNYFYARMLYLPRYGHVFANHIATVPPPPSRSSESSVATEAKPQMEMPAAIAERLSRHLGSEIITLQAQDHYVRVVTPVGAELILYRFCDAIRELPPELGVRVHRSYWVSRAAVDRIMHRRGRHYLLMNNGERVPVSRTYLADARRMLCQAETSGA